MPRTTSPNFRKNLLALAAAATLTPAATWALELVQSPPLPTSKSPYTAPNVIISLDDSGSMDYCLNKESKTQCTFVATNNNFRVGFGTTVSPYYCLGTTYKLDEAKKNCSIWIGATDEIEPVNGTWPITSRRMNVLKYSVNKVFKNEEILPTDKNSLRIAWQTMNGSGGNVVKAEKNVNNISMAVNSMRPINTIISTDKNGKTTTHRDKFLTFIKNLKASGGTPSQSMFRYADEYMRNDPSPTGPWSTNPGGTDDASQEYLGCRRNYHIMMTDGRWNTVVHDLPDTTKRDNAISLALPNGNPVYSGTDSALYRDESTATTMADWAFYSWAVPLVPTSKLKNANKLTQPLSYTEALDTETLVDGANSVTLKKFWNPKYNPADWPHMVTYTIGFSQLAYSWNYSQITAPTEMAPFGYDGSFIGLAKGTVKWPDLTKDTESRNALDLWHAALNGRGRFYAIETGEDLEKSFKEIIGKINEENTKLPQKGFPGGTSSGYNISQNNAGLFASAYDAKGWNGSITATNAREPEEYGCPTKEDSNAKCIKFPSSITEWKEKNTAQHLDDPIFSVDGRLILSWSDKTNGGVDFKWADDDSKLSTSQKSLLGRASDDTEATVYTRGKNVLDFIRGDRSLQAAPPPPVTTPPTPIPPPNPAKPFRTRTSRQGDIVNSEIWYTGSPISRLTLSGYSAFVTTHKDRLPMLYVGGNDGMLHGFSAKNGKEQLAYVPRGVFAGLKELANPNYEHRYFVDGSPMTGDVKDTTWKTLLVGTLGAGGKGYFVLDVTDPSGFNATKAAALVALDRTRSNKETVLNCSTFTGTQETKCITAVDEDRDIGNIVAQPVRNTANPQETTQITRMNNDRWAVVMGNGYNSANQRPVLLVQYLDGSNKQLKRIQATTNEVGSGNSKDNGLSAPTLVDLNGDGRTDVVYAGDNLGNLWKFDLTSGNDSDWAVAFGDNKPIFKASGPKLIDGARDQVQPITAPPIVRANDRSMIVDTGGGSKTVAVGGMTVAFGTGRNLTSDDRQTDGTQNVQTLYSVLDNTRYQIRDKTKPKDEQRLKAHLGDASKDIPAPKVVTKPLAKQTIADIASLAGFATVNATEELKKETWKSYEGWYLDLPNIGERLLAPMQFWDGSNILAVYTTSPSGTISSASDNINESCVDVKVNTSLGSQYRTLINIMDGKVPTIPLVDASGDGVFNSVDKNAARMAVSTGSPLLITTTKNILDHTGIGSDPTKAIKGARMPEQSLRPSWRQLK